MEIYIKEELEAEDHQSFYIEYEDGHVILRAEEKSMGTIYVTLTESVEKLDYVIEELIGKLDKFRSVIHAAEKENNNA
jgi:hypothetical protein